MKAKTNKVDEIPEVDLWNAESVAVDLKMVAIHEQAYVWCRCGREFYASGKPEDVRRKQDKWEKHKCEAKRQGG